MTREDWLQRASAVMQGWIADSTGLAQPSVHVSVGFAKGSKCKLERMLGACFRAEYSVDGNPHVFISPIIAGEPAGEQGVLATLLHELVHAAVGVEKGHKAAFSLVAKAVGLQRPWRATKAGPELQRKLEALALQLGPWEHQQLLLPEREAKQRVARVTLGDRLGAEARIVIPTEDKDGKALGAEFISEFLHEAAELFGGYSAWCASGGWVNPDGKLMEELVEIVDIATAKGAEAQGKLEALAERIREAGNQWTVYLRLPSGVVELIGDNNDH